MDIDFDTRAQTIERGTLIKLDFELPGRDRFKTWCERWVFFFWDGGEICWVGLEDWRVGKRGKKRGGNEERN
jgi:hypothetical protein